jgi:protein TonB
MPSGDSDVIPLVRVSPQYPVAASQRRLEGWVLVEFTITSAGTVTDATAVQAEPPGVFESAALQAVRRWKYKPGVRDGKPFNRPGVRVKLDFKLRDKEA